MTAKQMRETESQLQNGNIQPRVRTTQNKLATALEPFANNAAKSWSSFRDTSSLFFLYEPKLPTKLQNIK